MKNYNSGVAYLLKFPYGTKKNSDGQAQWAAYYAYGTPFNRRRKFSHKYLNIQLYQNIRGDVSQSSTDCVQLNLIQLQKSKIRWVKFHPLVSLFSWQNGFWCALSFIRLPQQLAQPHHSSSVQTILAAELFLLFIPGSASELTGFICMILQRLMYSDFDSGF